MSDRIHNLLETRTKECSELKARLEEVYKELNRVRSERDELQRKLYEVRESRRLIELACEEGARQADIEAERADEAQGKYNELKQREFAFEEALQFLLVECQAVECLEWDAGELTQWCGQPYSKREFIANSMTRISFEIIESFCEEIQEKIDRALKITFAVKKEIEDE